MLIILAFKLYMSKTAESEFRYYEPTPQEAEAERMNSFSEKRTKHSEMEKRFLHPALQHDKLFTIMVHKSQEALARDVLSAYPWFAGKHHDDGVPIQAVREEQLEYDPLRDGPRGEAHQAEWDARSIGSTDMLGGKSEMGIMSTHSGMDPYNHYPLPTQESPSAFQSNVNLPLDNPSTDQLLSRPERSDTYRGRRQNSSPLQRHKSPGIEQDPSLAAPLLDYAQDPRAVPYPPSAYTQPPHGYTPPTLRRSTTNASSDNETVGAARWDEGRDVGAGGIYGRVDRYESREDLSGGGGPDDHYRGYGAEPAPSYRTHASPQLRGPRQQNSAPHAYNDPYSRFEQGRGGPDW